MASESPRKKQKIMEIEPNSVYICGAARTPIGSFGGSLASVDGPKLGAAAIKGALAKSGVDAALVEEAYVGNVLTAGEGQAPARQAAVFAGLPDSTVCTTINKVCASGLKAAALGAQNIMLGFNDVVVAGGFENMSAVPYYLTKQRFGSKLGHVETQDGVIKDGLWDVYGDQHMGDCAELCASNHDLSREQQDTYCINSYKKAAAAHEAGLFKDEIVPVEVKGARGAVNLVEKDEEYTKVDFNKVPNLRPVFKKDGTVTAANASSLNDGGAAVVLVSGKKVKELGLKPLAVVRGFADAEQKSEFFTVSPALAIPKAVERANLKMDDMDYFEINEAFSAVALANLKLLGVSEEKCNVNGGAVALGHPLGCSGARILVTLLSVLKQKNARYGCAGICNGGGGASAMVVERFQ